MTSADLAELLIEGPKIVIEDIAGPLSFSTRSSDPTRTADTHNSRDQAPNDTDAEGFDDEDEAPNIDKKIAVYLNRAILRIFSVPSLMTFLKDVVLFPDTQSKDGQCRIQFVFHRLPEEAHPMLVKLLASPQDPKFTRFVDKGQARTGLELEVSPEDFGGEEYDYAF